MTIKRFIRISQPKTDVILGNVPIVFNRARVSKLLIKPPVSFQDEKTHYLKLHICELQGDNKDVTVPRSVKPYVFVLPIAGCEKGYTTWNNCIAGCWDYVTTTRKNEINFTIHATIDDTDVVFDDELLIELEFE